MNESIQKIGDIVFAKAPVIDPYQSCQSIEATLNNWWVGRGNWQYETQNVRDVLAVLIGFEVLMLLIPYAIGFMEKGKHRTVAENMFHSVNDFAPYIRMGLLVTTFYFLVVMSPQ